MNPAELQEILGYLDKLIEATASGSFHWSPANPTTYVWQTTAARLTLQKLAPGIVNSAMASGGPTPSANELRALLGRLDAHYVLQGHENANTVLSLNGRDDPLINSRLKLLYESITIGETRRGLDFLKGIIKKD